MISCKRVCWLFTVSVAPAEAGVSSALVVVASGVGLAAFFGPLAGAEGVAALGAAGVVVGAFSAGLAVPLVVAPLPAGCPAGASPSPSGVAGAPVGAGTPAPGCTRRGWQAD